MNKKITKSISQIIIDKEDLFKISDFVFDEYSKAKSEHKELNITINCEDNETYEFKNTKLERGSSILDFKKILHISISFIDYRNNKKINITISQGNNDWSNNYIVEGNEENWVNSKNSKIEAIFASIKSQNNIFAKYKKILFHFLALNLGFLFFRILFACLEKFGYYKSTNPDISNPFIFLMDSFVGMFPFLKYVLFVLTSWGIGVWILFYIFWDKIERYLENLLPSIEFDFGPEHKKYPKKQRKALTTIIFLVVIPIILQIIFYYL